MLIFAEFLPTKFFKVFENRYKAHEEWCQERDLNPRPPAYEVCTSLSGKIISRQTYSKLKHNTIGFLRYINENKIKINTEVTTLDFTPNSQQKGKKSEFICRVFADLIWSADARLFSLSKEIQSIYMSIYLALINSIPTNPLHLVSHVKPLDRYSCKLISIISKNTGETR